MGSILNTISLLLSQSIYLISFYLGCVILFYSEKKDRQAIVAGISFFLCSLFFIGHLLVLGKGFIYILSLSSSIIQPTIIILSLLPLAWTYIVYRFYDDIFLFRKFSFRNTVFLILAIYFLITTFIVIYFIPIQKNRTVYDIILQIPDTVFYIYSCYIILCTLSSILFLLRTELKSNSLEEIAKSSSYRTILNSSYILFFLSILVGIGSIQGRDYLNVEISSIRSNPFPSFLLFLDSIANIAIMATIVIVGRAVISYQVFTGRYLAMKSLKEYWRNISIFVFANGFILVCSGLLGYSTDLKQVLINFLAIFSIVQVQMISRKREEENKKTLKPFLFNENLYLSITDTSQRIEFQLEKTFQLLCDTTLNTTRACLIPLGAYSSYIPKPLFYPEENLDFKINNFLSQVPQNKSLFYLNREKFSGYVLGITIQDKNENIGVLYLGVKKDYTLYTEEEIDIARIGSGKIMDLLSVAEISRLLVNLQKKQLMDSKILDHQTRRVLHDDILPEIHSIMIEIDSMTNELAKKNLINSLSDLHKKISNLLKLIPLHPTNLNHTNFIIEIKNLVKSELGGESVQYQIQEEAEKKLELLESIALEVIYYAVRELLRNISRYARSPDRALEVQINLILENGNLELWIEDNGKGYEESKEQKGAGQGLLLHSTLMAVIGGALIKETHIGESTKVRLILKKFFL